MKKLICIIICIVLVLAAAAAIIIAAYRSKTPDTPQTGVTSAPTQPSLPPVQVPPLNMVSISLPLIHEPTRADDGTVVFRHSFQDVSLNIPDANVARTITLHLLQQMDNNSENAVTLRKQAKNDYTPGTAWTPYYYEVTYTPTRMDETVLSLSGAHVSFDGFAPSTTPSSATYDLVSGKYLAVSDILSDAEGASDVMCQKLIAQLDLIAAEKSLFPTYKATIESSFSMDLNRYYSWYFSNEGLCFYFAPYEIAPNSAGTVQVTIPYSDLVGILSDAYFPVEQPSISATVSSAWFDQADLTQFSQFADLMSDPDARRGLLWSDTVGYDVRTEQGNWDVETNKCTPQATIFAANCFAEGDALILRHALSDTAPNLRLLYTCDGVTQIRYIAKDPANDTIVLISPTN